MSFDDQGKKAMQHRSLLQAIGITGGIAALAKKIGIEDPSRISKWLNEDIKIPLSFGLLIEKVTKIDFWRLCPFDKKANDYINERGAWLRNPFIDIEAKNILVNVDLHARVIPSERPIIIATDQALISGFYQLEAHKINHCETVKVIIVDLEALWSKVKTYADFHFDFLIEEKVWMGVWIEKWRGNHSGERNDLDPSRPLKRSRAQKKSDKSYTPRPPVDEVCGRKDIRIAEILAFGCKSTYHNAKHVCFYGIPELIHAMNRKQITITEAAKLSKQTHAEQRAWIQSGLLAGVTIP